jgi:hypothetical protein
MPAPARGRPPKYGRRSQAVAVTLPREVVARLRRLHSDLGWAIVGLVEKNGHAIGRRASDGHPELAEIGNSEFLIVVDPAQFRWLRSVRLVPISENQAFLALEPGHGIADLELAVRDRLENVRTSATERAAIGTLATKLRKWRRNTRLDFHARSIIIVGKRPAKR